MYSLCSAPPRAPTLSRKRRSTRHARAGGVRIDMWPTRPPTSRSGACHDSKHSGASGCFPLSRRKRATASASAPPRASCLSTCLLSSTLREWLEAKRSLRCTATTECSHSLCCSTHRQSLRAAAPISSVRGASTAPPSEWACCTRPWYATLATPSLEVCATCLWASADSRPPRSRPGLHAGALGRTRHGSSRRAW